MLRRLSYQIRCCYDGAEECLRKAEDSVSQEWREAYGQIAGNWLKLAKSYEFTERLTDFTNEQRRRKDLSRLHEA